MLEGKNVIVKDKSILTFFYPDYVESSTLGEDTLGKKVIYTGRFKPSLVGELRMLTKSYISLCGVPEVILNTHMDWVKLAYSKRGKSPPKYVEEAISSLDENDIWYCIKSVWVSGRWPIKAVPSDKIFSLFQAATISFTELLKQYHRLLEEYPFPYIESSFITFLMKVRHAPEMTTETVSAKYLQVLRTTYSRVRGRLDQSIDLYFKQQKEEVYFLQLLFNLFQ